MMKSGFEIDQTIPSCQVSLELLEKIEQFFKQQVFPESARELWISVVEPAGSERLSNDSKLSISIPCKGHQKRRDRVIRFRRRDRGEFRPRQCEFKAVFYGPGLPGASAKDTVRPQRLLEPYETLNRLMHPGPALWTLEYMLLSCLFAATVATMVMKAWGEGPNIRYEWLMLCIAAFPALFAIYRLKPYSSFDTRENKSRNTIGNWLILALASAVLSLIVRLAWARLSP
jgi:hypothetical protein